METLTEALTLLDRAIADQDRAEHRGDLALYHWSERWDFVRGARALLRLAEAERTPTRERVPA